jgi:dTDP-4-dehydrorhamnose reductase
MLGNAVYKFLKGSHEVTVILRRWPSVAFKDEVSSYRGDYIINCVGAIPQRTKDFSINYDLPVWLEQNAACRIIHPGTDCEMDDDEYGVSKKEAAEFIKSRGERTKIIKTSIIGHELTTTCSLLDWFLNSEGEVFGYTRAYWNGNTTLQWAKECYSLMINWGEYDKCTVFATECLSKFELLNIIKDVYRKDIIIHPKDNVPVNKCLVGRVIVPSIRQQLIELRDFYQLKHKGYIDKAIVGLEDEYIEEVELYKTYGGD